MAHFMLATVYRGSYRILGGKGRLSNSNCNPAVSTTSGVSRFQLLCEYSQNQHQLVNCTCLESQWLVIKGYFQSITGYFGA